MAERIRLSEHFTYKKLFRFVLPSIIMMVFTSVYSIVDGFFVSNFTGPIQFAALNLIFPLISIFASVGFMLGTGGNAIVSKTLGEGDKEKANRIFSMLIYTTAVIGFSLSIIGIAIVRPVAIAFAETEQTLNAADKAKLIEYCVLYARIILLALPGFMLQNAFQGFFVTAEKPRLGLYVTIIAGVGNIIFDALFVVVFQWDLAGAAIATALNQVIGGVIPIIYFARKNDSLLRLCKTNFQFKVFVSVCVNGLSELMTNISISIVSILFNAQLMTYIGIDGVSAYGIMMYIGFIFIGIFIGYSFGCAPIIGYHYGAQNRPELKNVFIKSATSLFVSGIVMTVIAIVFANPLSAIFVKEQTLLDITAHGLRLYAFGFLVCGFNIFSSSFFTALSNGGISLLISFFRTFVCQIIAVLTLPAILNGADGIWLAVPASELVSLFLTVAVTILYKERYGYL